MLNICVAFAGKKNKREKNTGDLIPELVRERRVQIDRTVG